MRYEYNPNTGLCHKLRGQTDHRKRSARYDNERAKIQTYEKEAEALREYWNWVAQEWNTKDDTACP